MHLKELRDSNRIIFECVSGSHAYGLNTANSDIDYRGIYVNPKNEYLSLRQPSLQISDDKNDTVFYSLKRFFELAENCNPNIIELLWIPDDCVTKCTDVYKKLVENRNLFISKKAYHTHYGYAISQIKKLKGQNKYINQSHIYDKGLAKLAKLLKDNTIDIDWLSENFSKEVVNVVQNMSKTI